MKDGVHGGRVNTMLYTRSRLLYNAFGVFCASGLDSDETRRDGHVLEESSRASTATRKRIDLFRNFTHTVGLEIRLADTVHTFTSLM